MDTLKPEQISQVVGLCNDTEWYSQIRRTLESRSVQPEINLSVIIPYYKRPLTLRQTLLSFLQSSYDLSLVEFIIVDDGSDNANRPDIQAYSDLGLNVKYAWQPDLGFRLSAARNLGLGCASYDNVIIVDCDLVVSKDFLLEHAWPLSISTNIVSIGLRENRVYPDKNTEVFKKKDPASIGTFERNDWRLEAWIDKVPNFEISDTCWQMSSGGNIGFHKSLIERAGNFEERFTFWGGEDLEWAYRAFKSGAYFLINRGAYAYHFESKPSEFQVPRDSSTSEKESLLKDLVPVRKPAYMSAEGEVPYISVFMTLYNKAEHLKEAIESIAKATKFRYEVIVVDDGSSDNCLDVLNSLKPHLKSKVSVHSRRHEGAEQTYIDCLKRCRGEFIAQLDADDILLPGSIDTLVHAIEDSISDVAYGKYKRFAEGQKQHSEGWVHPICDRHLSIFEGMHTHPLRVFRRRALGRVGGFRALNLTAAVDFSLYSQLLLASCGVFVDEYTYLYRSLPTSLSAARSEHQTRNTRDVIEDNVKRMILPTHVCRYAISEHGTKRYQISVDHSVDRLIYLDHLKLRKSEFSELIARNPSAFIHPKVLKAQSEAQMRRVKIQDKVTGLQFEVSMTPTEFVRYYKECLKKSAGTVPPVDHKVKLRAL
ncbi:MAG: glycosyltransferase family 2 protein [Candidatus Thorarchaeota archaeon]